MQAAAPTVNPFAKLPLAFERRGEGSREQYVARWNGYVIALQGGSATIGVQPQVAAVSTVSMDFAGARKVSATAGPELPGKVNYLFGNDPKQWRFGLSTYSSVTYREIYPGIDVVYRGNQRQMEFDLVLKPEANPKEIRLQFDRARELTLDADGALVVHSVAGDLRIPLPVIYQEVAGARKTIRGRYGLMPNHQVGFRLDAYDRGKPLVIDPTIVYASPIGGGTDATVSYAIAVDSSSNAYITGYTNASDFPTANAAFPQMEAAPDGFVSKIDPTGTTLLYSTYIGGSGSDTFKSIAVDSTGAAWVTGYTTSTDFPVLNAYQSKLSGEDAVVLKLSPTGGLLYSTYLGSGGIFGYGIAVDPNLSAYVTGLVIGGGTIPTTAGAYQTSPPRGYDGFVTKFNSSGGLVYSTYLGGTSAIPFGTSTNQVNAIAVDAGGNAYVTGYSNSAGFPNSPPGGAQVSNDGNDDAFVAKLNADGSALAYFTFLGGSQTDIGWAIAVDANGNAYVGGYTDSPDFPVTAGALQTALGGGADGFIAKLNSAGSAFEYVTYLGGIRQDVVKGISIDGNGNAYVTGQTDSAQFPVMAPIEGGLSGNSISLYQTTNTAGSWSPIDGSIPGAVTSVSPHPAPGAIVAATEAGIFRSVNSGQSWTQTSPFASAYLSRSPVNSSVIYAIACCTSVYLSTDDGVTWNLQGYPSVASWIVADPTNAYSAYAWGFGSAPQKTTDGGVTWKPSGSGLPSATFWSMVAASDGSLYADLDGSGVFKSTNQGASWAAANTGLGSFSATLNGLAVSASNPAVLYKSVLSTGIYATTNGGASWSLASGTAPATLGPLAVSATNPSLIYAATSAGYPALYESSDAGKTWNPAGAGLGVASLSQIVADPTNSSAAYALAPVTTAAFAAEINSSGSALVYSTYLGSSNYAYGYGIAVNSSGDAFVTGASYGTFPIKSTTFQGNQNSTEGFVVRITGATVACSYTLSPATETIYSGAQVLTYSVVSPSGCTWNAISNQSWAAIVSGATGSGTGLLSVSVSANATGASRAATLTIGGQAATITQAPSSCSYTLGTPGASLGTGGGSVQTTVLTSAGCPWTVVNDYPFAVTVVSGASGTGNGNVMLSVGTSASVASRTLNIPIGGANLSISQAGYSAVVTTDPAGLSVVVDGMTYFAQANFNWTPGSNHIVNVTSPQYGTGTQYVFSNWSDGGTQSHTIVAPSPGTTYTAHFTTQYLLTTSVAPGASGTVTANPSSGNGYYNAGASVQLTAMPVTTYAFSGYSGDLTGRINPQTIVMSAPRTVTANFVLLPVRHRGR